MHKALERAFKVTEKIKGLLMHTHIYIYIYIYIYVYIYTYTYATFGGFECLGHDFGWFSSGFGAILGGLSRFRNYFGR